MNIGTGKWLYALLVYAGTSQLHAAGQVPTSPKTAASEKTLILAMYHSPPYYFTEGVKRPKGISLDLLKPVAQQLGLKIKVVVCPFSRCLKLAEQGTVDLVAGLIKSTDREQYLHYLEPPIMNFHSSFVFFSKHERNDDLFQLGDLRGRSIAVMRDALYFPEFDEYTAAQKIEVNTESIVMEMVQLGRVDYAISVQQTAAGAMAGANMPADALKLQPYAVKQNIRGYIAFSKNSANYSYAPLLEQAFKRHYQQGLYHYLWQKYHLPAMP